MTTKTHSHDRLTTFPALRGMLSSELEQVLDHEEVDLGKFRSSQSNIGKSSIWTGSVPSFKSGESQSFSCVRWALCRGELEPPHHQGNLPNPLLCTRVPQLGRQRHLLSRTAQQSMHAQPPHLPARYSSRHAACNSISSISSIRKSHWPHLQELYLGACGAIQSRTKSENALLSAKLGGRGCPSWKWESNGVPVRTSWG